MKKEEDRPRRSVELSECLDPSVFEGNVRIEIEYPETPERQLAEIVIGRGELPIDGRAVNLWTARVLGSVRDQRILFHLDALRRALAFVRVQGPDGFAEYERVSAEGLRDRLARMLSLANRPEFPRTLSIVDALVPGGGGDIHSLEHLDGPLPQDGPRIVAISRVVLHDPAEWKRLNPGSRLKTACLPISGELAGQAALTRSQLRRDGPARISGVDASDAATFIEGFVGSLRPMNLYASHALVTALKLANERDAMDGRDFTFSSEDFCAAVRRLCFLDREPDGHLSDYIAGLRSLNGVLFKFCLRERDEANHLLITTKGPAPILFVADRTMESLDDRQPRLRRREFVCHLNDPLRIGKTGKGGKVSWYKPLREDAIGRLHIAAKELSKNPKQFNRVCRASLLLVLGILWRPDGVETFHKGESALLEMLDLDEDSTARPAAKKHRHLTRCPEMAHLVFAVLERAGILGPHEVRDRGAEEPIWEAAIRWDSVLVRSESRKEEKPSQSQVLAAK